MDAHFIPYLIDVFKDLSVRTRWMKSLLGQSPQ